MNIVQLIGSWEGRIGRGPYALTFLALVMIALVTSILFGNGIKSTTMSPAELLVALASTYVSWVTAVKRAHDLDRSGWWVFRWYLAIFGAVVLVTIGVIFSATGNSGGAILFFLGSVGLSLAAIWCLVIKLFFFAGTPGNNQFGPPSTGAAHAAADIEDASAHNRAHDAIAAAVAQRAATQQRPKAVHPLAALETAPQTRGLPPAAKPAFAKPQAFGRRGLKPA